MDTLALDTAVWDFDVDLAGNVATLGDSTGTPALRMAQDAATQCLTFRGEAYYDATQGVRYSQILGRPNLVFATNEYQTQALRAQGVVQAVASLTYASGSRALTGAIYVTDASGLSGMVNL